MPIKKTASFGITRDEAYDMVLPGMKEAHYGKHTPAPTAYYPPMKESLNMNPAVVSSFNTI
jgi:hypothetical protein